MSHRSFPIAILLAALLVGLPGQSFATPMGEGAAASSGSSSGGGDKDMDKLQEILKEIFTLGGLFDSGGSRHGSNIGSPDPTKPNLGADESLGSAQWAGGMDEEIFRLPIIYSEVPMPRDRNLAAPVPEPTGALLFGMGILAVASRRARSQRLS